MGDIRGENSLGFSPGPIHIPPADTNVGLDGPYMELGPPIKGLLLSQPNVECGLPTVRE
jgi:hypothetical protein